MRQSKTQQLRRVALSFVLALGLAPVSARAFDIDNFDAAGTANQLFRLSGPNGTELTPRQTQDNVNGVLGGERDLMVLVADLPAGVNPLPNALMGAIGRPTVGLLEIATSGNYGSQVHLQYDGEDAVNGGEPGNPIVDVLGLGGVDLSDAGASDRFRFNIVSAQSQDGVALEVSVTIRGQGDGIATAAGFAPDSLTPSSYDLMFSQFQYANGGTFESVIQSARSITFIFNPNSVPNADFMIDSIVTVPEPSTVALLGMAGVAGVVYRLRKRRV
jgi:hypothetical protein